MDEAEAKEEIEGLAAMNATELETWSDHVLNWLLTEEGISMEFREIAEAEMLRRMSPDDMITLTAESIHAAATNNGGWTRAQLSVIGIKWPPRHGWISDVVGTRISMRRYKDFVEAKHIKAKKH